MHELAICCSLVDVVCAELRRQGGGRVREIRMSIGGLQSIEPATLVSSFDIVSADTPLRGAVLKVRRRPLRVLCRACDGERTATPSFRCETCGSGEVQMLPGEGMTVDEIVLS